MPEPLFLLLYRSQGESAAERAVDGARAAALRDTVKRLEKRLAALGPDATERGSRIPPGSV